MRDDGALREGSEPERTPADYEPPHAEDVSAHDSIDTASMVISN